MKRIRRTYTAKQKTTAVDACIKAGIKKTSLKRDIPAATLNKWLKDHRNGIEMTKTKAGRKKKEIVCSERKVVIEKTGA